MARSSYRPPVDEALPVELRAIIIRCWQPEPAARPRCGWLNLGPRAGGLISRTIKSLECIRPFLNHLPLATCHLPVPLSLKLRNVLPFPTACPRWSAFLPSLKRLWTGRHLRSITTRSSHKLNAAAVALSHDLSVSMLLIPSSLYLVRIIISY